MGAIFLLGLNAQAATWFVAINGSDASANGSISNPWRTVAYATSRMSDGDTLNLRAGTFVETNWMWQMSNWKSGSTIQSYPGEKATIRQSDTNAFEVIRIGGIKSNIVFSGLVFDNQLARRDTAGTTVVKLTDNSRGITFTNCVIMNSPRGHGALVNTTGDTTGNHRFVDCLFTNIAWDSQVGDSPPHCAYIQSASNLIERCVFENGKQDFGIHNFDPGAVGNIYRQNIFRNAGRAIGLVRGGFNQVYNNLVYSNNSMGIELNYGTYSNTVANNTVTRNKGGIILSSGNGNVVENNLVTECSGNWALAVNEGMTNTLLQNNLICSNAAYYAGQYLYFAGTGTVSNANLFGDSYYAGVAAPPNARLLSGSDAIDAGRVQSFFEDDLTGRIRKGYWDIGAFEYAILPPSNLHSTGP